MADISKITIPNPRAGESGQPSTLTFDIKDSVARQAVIAGFAFKVCTTAANTPQGVTWISGSTTITGTLSPTDDGGNPRKGFYLVPGTDTETADGYREYIVAQLTESPATYAWEKLGDTEIDFSDIAKYLDTLVVPTTDKVLGESTTFTNASSSVTIPYTKTVDFVKSYPGASSKLVQGSVLGVKSNTTTASLASAGTAKDVAKAASSTTAISYVGNSGTTEVLEKATVDGETLILGKVDVSQGSVTSAVSNGTITPYTFTDVTVPIKDDSSSTFATGALDSNGGGASVMTGLGTATTEKAVTVIGSGSSSGSGTAAAQTITVGTNDKVDAMTGVSVTIINKTNS